MQNQRLKVQTPSPNNLVNHGLPNLTSPSRGPLEAVRMALVVKHSLIDFFLRVQNKGTILDDLLIKGEPSNEN